jgi:transposase
LYTFVTNKAGRGKKGSLVAVIKETKSQDIIDVVCNIPLEVRKRVKTISCDMANSMQAAAKMCFPEAEVITDRFHVVRLVLDALQHFRVKYRWEEIEKENQAIKEAKEQGVKYVPVHLPNGDTQSNY